MQQECMEVCIPLKVLPTVMAPVCVCVCVCVVCVCGVCVHMSVFVVSVFVHHCVAAKVFELPAMGWQWMIIG